MNFKLGQAVWMINDLNNALGSVKAMEQLSVKGKVVTMAGTTAAGPVIAVDYETTHHSAAGYLSEEESKMFLESGLRDKLEVVQGLEFKKAV